MSQHQHAFLADSADDIAHVARRVLTMLAKRDDQGAGAARSAGLAEAVDRCGPVGAALETLAHQLYVTSIDRDPAQFDSALTRLSGAGLDDDVLAFDLIPDIARQLGTAWVDDTISFADVTVGCSRLQRAMHHMPDHSPAAPIARPNHIARTCLVMVPQHAQHTLGALVLARTLRQAQHQVHLTLEANPQVLAQLARRHRFDLVLVSASPAECPEMLGQLIDLSRQHWGACRFALGGSIRDLTRSFAARVGADLVTNDWQEALDLCI